MPIILHFFKELWSLLKEVPWKVWAFIGLLALIWMWGTHKHEQGYNEAVAEYEKLLVKQNREAERKRDELEQKYKETVEAYIKERDQGYEKRDAIIADWQSGRLRLKARFVQKACPASGSDAGETAGLSGEDVQFLIREAARADGIVRQLTACQGIIKDGEEGTK